MADAAQLLIETVNVTGGVIAVGNGLYAPVADKSWIDLADVYFAACREKNVKPVIQSDENE